MVKRDMHKLTLGSTLALIAALGGCDWSKFDDLESQAPVRTLDAPGSYRSSGYGSVLAAFNGTIDDKQVSRLFGSAGADSPIVVERFWDGTKLDGGTTIRCKKKDDCAKGVGVGSTLIPFAVWAQGTKQEQRGCVLSPGDPNAFVFCETNSAGSQNFPLNIDGVKGEASTLRFSGAGLPTGHPLGVALVGVYSFSERTMEPANGGLYYQGDLKGSAAPPLRRLDLYDPRTKQAFSDNDDAGDLGYAVAAQTNDKGELLIAVSQPSQNRVVIATFDDSIAVDPGITETSKILSAKLRTRACLKSPDPEIVGFGKKIAIGDINDDGQPEIFVGIDPLDGKNGDKQRLWAYRGQDLPAVEDVKDVCPLWNSEPVQVGCYGGVRGVACENTAFGASMAIGDVDGDKHGDLIVGAPLASVQGMKESGVVWVIPGGGSDDNAGLNFDAMTNLYASSFEDKGRVGTSVVALRTKDRDEPAAGAPGSDRVYVFMCSKLESSLKPEDLCLPK